MFPNADYVRFVDEAVDVLPEEVAGHLVRPIVESLMINSFKDPRATVRPDKLVDLAHRKYEKFIYTDAVQSMIKTAVRDGVSDTPEIFDSNLSMLDVAQELINYIQPIEG